MALPSRLSPQSLAPAALGRRTGQGGAPGKWRPLQGTSRCGPEPPATRQTPAGQLAASQGSSVALSSAALITTITTAITMDTFTTIYIVDTDIVIPRITVITTLTTDHSLEAVEVVVEILVKVLYLALAWAELLDVVYLLMLQWELQLVRICHYLLPKHFLSEVNYK